MNRFSCDASGYALHSSAWRNRRKRARRRRGGGGGDDGDDEVRGRLVVGVFEDGELENDKGGGMGWDGEHAVKEVDDGDSSTGSVSSVKGHGPLAPFHRKASRRRLDENESR